MADSRYRPRFHGEGSSLLGIFVVCMLLTMVTLGIYSFWARARIRRYMWNAVEFEGDRFTWHGTGGELLKGWLMAAGVFLGLFVVLFVAALAGDAAAILGIVIFYCTILALIPLAILGARRYRLSRTSWRGIRFSQHGDTAAFIRMWIGGTLLTAITLSLYRPYFEVKQRTFLWNDTRLGTESFGFQGDGSDLFKKYLLALLLTIPTLGLYWFWYAAFRTRYMWERTTFQDARFQSTVTGGGLLGLTVTNMLLIIFTLGIGTPWALVRMMDYYSDNLVVEGALDFTTIEQRRGAEVGSAEGLADVLDVGGFDIGL